MWPGEPLRVASSPGGERSTRGSIDEKVGERAGPPLDVTRSDRSRRARTGENVLVAANGGRKHRKPRGQRLEEDDTERLPMGGRSDEEVCSGVFLPASLLVHGAEQAHREVVPARAGVEFVPERPLAHDPEFAGRQSAGLQGTRECAKENAMSLARVEAAQGEYP
jgi:hypothetical protein